MLLGLYDNIMHGFISCIAHRTVSFGSYANYTAALDRETLIVNLKITFPAQNNISLFILLVGMEERNSLIGL